MLSGTWFLHHLLRPPLLSAAWPAFVSNEGPKTCAEAAGKIEEITGIRRCNTQVRVFLKKRGVRYRKVGSVPAGADPDEQEQFLKKNSHAQNRAGLKGQALFIFQSSFLFIAGEPLWKIQAFFATKIPPRQSATFEPWAWNRPGTPWKTTFVAQKHTHSPKR